MLSSLFCYCKLSIASVSSLDCHGLICPPSNDCTGIVIVNHVKHSVEFIMVNNLIVNLYLRAVVSPC